MQNEENYIKIKVPFLITKGSEIAVSRDGELKILYHPQDDEIFNPEDDKFLYEKFKVLCKEIRRYV